MKILLNDPIALSQLHRIEMIYPLLSLNCDFFAGTELNYQLSDDLQPNYMELIDRGRIKELVIKEEDLILIQPLQQQLPFLSQFEIHSLFLAQKHDLSLLITQPILQQSADKLGIDYLNVDWVFDQIFTQQIMGIASLMLYWNKLKNNTHSYTQWSEPQCIRRFYQGTEGAALLKREKFRERDSFRLKSKPKETWSSDVYDRWRQNHQNNQRQ